MVKSVLLHKIEIVIYDTDELAIKNTLKLLEMVDSILENIELNVTSHCCNFILDNINDKFNYIIMNPPYRKMNRHDVSDEFNTYINGQPNIYHLFIIKTLQLLNTKGSLCLISPKNYLSGRYTESLRKYLFSKFSIHKVHTLNNRHSVFDYKITQEICMVHIRKSISSKVYLSYNGFNTFEFDSLTLLIMIPKYFLHLDMSKTAR